MGKTSLNITPDWSKTLEKGNLSGGNNPTLSNGDSIEAENGDSFIDLRSGANDGFTSISDKLFINETNGFVGVGALSSLGAESFRVDGFAKIDNTLGLNGAVPASQGAINVPRNSNALAFNNIKAIWQNDTTGLHFQSIGIFKMNFDVGLNQRFMELDNTSAGNNNKEMQLYSSDSTTAIDNENDVAINLHSTYFDGSQSQTKKVGLKHVAEASSALSSLEINIDDVNTLKIKEDYTFETRAYESDGVTLGDTVSFKIVKVSGTGAGSNYAFKIDFVS